MSSSDTGDVDSAHKIESQTSLALDFAARVGEAFRKQAQCRIVVDSCGDFLPEIADALGIEVIGFPFVMSGVEHIDDLWKSISPKDFYDRMGKGEIVTTSAVTPGRYLEIFERMSEDSLPVVYLSFPAALSSSFYSAQQAAKMVSERHPGFHIEIIDALCASGAISLLAFEAVRKAATGMPFDELVTWIRNARYFLHGYFTLDNFDALARGGRIPAAAAQIGGKLGIKAELSYGLDASLSLKGMCRGRKKALRSLVADFQANWCGDTSLPVAIVSADAEKDEVWLEEEIKRVVLSADKIIFIHSPVSPVLGAHVGPKMVAVTFWGTDRREKTSRADRLVQRVKGKGC